MFSNISCRVSELNFSLSVTLVNSMHIMSDISDTIYLHAYFIPVSIKNKCIKTHSDRLLLFIGYSLFQKILIKFTYIITMRYAHTHTHAYIYIGKDEIKKNV